MRVIGDRQPCFIVCDSPDVHSAASAGADAVIDADPQEAVKSGLLLGVRVDAAVEPLAGAADFLLLGDGEITNRPFIEMCARLGLPTFMGTGGSSLKEVTRAVGWFQLAFRQGDIAAPPRRRLKLAGESLLVLLHGSLLEKPGDADHGLRAMQRMHEQSLMPVGFEDRSAGAQVAPLAVASGAIAVIRKLDESFAAMAAAVRRAETILGQSRKQPSPGEQAVAVKLRRRVVLARDLDAGHTLTRQDLDFAQPAPGDGEFAPYHVDEVIGRALLRAMQAGDAVSAETLTGQAPEPPPWFSPRPPREAPKDEHA